jgi:hypothetical protein
VAGNDDLQQHVPLGQMRNELSEAGFDVPLDASRIEVMELHEELLVKSQLSFFNNESIKYPIFPTDVLDFASEKMTLISEFDFKEGGQFIRDERLDSATVVDLVGIFLDYVELTGKRVTATLRLDQYRGVVDRGNLRHGVLGEKRYITHTTTTE